MSESSDKIMFQYVMNYKAYRRHAAITRVGITLIVAGGLLGFCALSIVLGIILAAIAMCFGAIAVVVSLAAEQTYTVYTDRIVLKSRGKDKRKTVRIADITSVKYRRAFYEKSLLTGTVTITAKTESGKTQRCKMKHITSAQQTIDYIKSTKEVKNESGK